MSYTVCLCNVECIVLCLVYKVKAYKLRRKKKNTGEAAKEGIKKKRKTKYELDNITWICSENMTSLAVNKLFII